MRVQVWPLLLLALQALGTKLCLNDALEAESSEVTSASLGLLQRQLDLSHRERNMVETRERRSLDRPFVFIVSAGRSGSTSILDMLNQIPGYDLKGNNNMASSFFEMYETRDKDYKTYGSPAQYSWLRSSQRNTTLRLLGLQRLTLGELNPSPQAKVIGFKDTKWSFHEHLLDLDLLMQAFNNSKVVLSTRNSMSEQLNSMRKVWGFSSYSKLAEANKVMSKFAESHAGRTFTLALEDFSVDKFNELLAFLGEENCKYTSIVHDNKGSTPTLTRSVNSDSISCN